MSATCPRDEGAAAVGIVGIIGVGAMGAPMARRLLERGFRVIVRDVVPEREAALIESGAVAAASAAELARQADVVLTVVVDSDQTDRVLFGEQGITQSGREGVTVVMCSTVAPRYAAGLASRLAESAIGVLDAPISGGPRRALAGTLSMMIGAPDAAIARVASVLEAVASQRFHVGQRVGDGSAMKIVNNMLAGINLAAAAEALALAERLGMDLAMVRDVVNASSGGSWMFGDRVPRILERDYAPRAATRILTKDVGLGLDAAEAASAPATLARAAHHIFAGALAQGLGEMDDAAVIEYCRAQIGFALHLD